MVIGLANGYAYNDSVFTIYSMRDIDQNDPLYSLVSNNDKTIDLDKLFDGTTDASEMGKIRKKFCDALNVNEDDLKCIMGQIKIKYRQETIDCLKESLNQQLEKQGLKIISDSKYSNPYSQLIKKLLSGIS